MTGTAELRARTGGRDVKRIVFSREQIAERVAAMGRDITAAYPDGETLLVLGLLKGSFIFVADLVREIERPVTGDFMVASRYGGGTVSHGQAGLVCGIGRPVTVHFVVAASYGAGTVSSGKVDLVYDPTTDLGEHHVLLVEHIIDSGTTLN